MKFFPSPSASEPSLLQRLGKGLQLVLMVSVLGLSLWLSDGQPAIATGVYDMPPVSPDIHVYDEAKLFSRLTLGKLEKKLKGITTDSGTIVDYVTLRRLDYGETIETFTEDLFSTWFPTEEVQAGHILMALDAVTNTAAIKVGSAIPEALTEEIATSVAQESLLIPIRDGNYNEAFLSSSDRLATVLAGNPDPGAPEVKSQIASVESTFTSAEDTDQGSATIIVVVLLILATAIPMITYFAYQR